MNDRTTYGQNCEQVRLLSVWRALNIVRCLDEPHEQCQFAPLIESRKRTESVTGCRERTRTTNFTARLLRSGLPGSDPEGVMHRYGIDAAHDHTWPYSYALTHPAPYCTYGGTTKIREFAASIVGYSCESGLTCGQTQGSYSTGRLTAKVDDILTLAAARVILNTVSTHTL
jgi:hypothetical protein